MAAPLVSVIIATARPDLLPEALRSISQQTWSGPLEVVVGHDGGPPLSFESTLPIRSFGTKTRSGPAAVRNEAFARATGSIFAFLDDDDLWYPDHLRAVVPVAAATRGLAFSDALLIHQGEGWQAPFRFRFTPEMLDETNPIILSTVAVHRRVWQTVGGFDASFWRYEAWDWFLRIRAAGLPLTRVPRITATYRFHERSTTADDSAMAEAFDRLRAKHGLGDLPRAHFALMCTDPRWAHLREG